MNSKKAFIITGVLFLLFAGFTAAVTLVDVRPIGLQRSEVVLAALNQFVFTHLGVSMWWYEVTDWLGLCEILAVVGFAGHGAVQLIKRRSLFRVDYQLLLLGGAYILAAAFTSYLNTRS